MAKESKGVMELSHIHMVPVLEERAKHNWQKTQKGKISIIINFYDVTKEKKEHIPNYLDFPDHYIEY